MKKFGIVLPGTESYINGFMAGSKRFGHSEYFLGYCCGEPIDGTLLHSTGHK